LYASTRERRLRRGESAAFGEARAARIRGSWLYRLIGAPLRFTYLFARFQGKAPEFSRSAIAVLIALCLALLAIGIIWHAELSIVPGKGLLWRNLIIFIIAPLLALPAIYAYVRYRVNKPA
jgi:hypothetical protein